MCDGRRRYSGGIYFFSVNLLRQDGNDLLIGHIGSL